MAGVPFTAGPEFLQTTSENVTGVTPASSATYRMVYHIHVANTNAASRAVSLWRGATGAETSGTELCEGHVITGNNEYDLYWPSGLRFDSTHFLVGLSSVDATSLVITVTGESFAVS
jgi:hypothetical protein